MSDIFAKPFKLSDAAAELLGDFTGDSSSVISAINSIEQTELKTDLMAIFETVVPELLAYAANRRILLIVSDGEHTIDTQKQSILDAAATLKQTGTIVIVVGVRASGAGYDFLERIATPGYFINATPDNAEEAIKGLNYLKSLLCAGGCSVAGNEYVGTPQRDYHNFANFEVTQGKVNLVGPGMRDLLPGNGLYVEMSEGEAGSLIRTSSPIALVAGRTYRVSFNAAGNQRSPGVGQGIKVFVREVDADSADPNIFEQTVFPDWDDGFQTFSFSFVPLADASVRINFQQVGTDSLLLHGSLIDNIKFEDATTLTVMLNDTFDEENVIFVPPSCGQSDAVAAIADAAAPTVERIFAGSTVLGGAETLQNLVPVMTSNTAPSGAASDSNGSANAWNVFDGTPVGWSSGVYFTPNLPAWLQYDFGSVKEVLRYAVTGCGTASRPNAFTFEGSNNGSSWTVLDTQSGALAVDARTEFTLAAPASYRYYRLRITSTYDANSYACVRELEILGMSPAPGEEIYRVGVSYVTNAGETAVVNTVDYTAENAEDVFRITVPLPTDPSVTTIRIWRSLGDDPVETEMYLLAEIPANQSVYIDSERRETFEARYDNSVVAPASNTTAIPAGGLGEGYDCDLYECTSEPPGAQSPDSSPLPDIESGYTPPQQYTSTKTVCAECESGEQNLTIPTQGGGYSYGSGVTIKHVVLSSALSVSVFGFKVSGAAASRADQPPLNVTFQGTNNQSSWTTISTHQNVNWMAGIQQVFQAENQASFLFYRITITSASDSATAYLATNSHFEVYSSNVARSCKTATRTSYVSQSDADTLATNAARAEAEAALNCRQVFTATDIYTAECPYNTYGAKVTKSVTKTSYVSYDEALRAAHEAAVLLANAELNCEGSNNSTKITIHDNTKADPYPSVKFISGLSGVISKVTVTLKRFNHGDYGDCNVLLVSPEGTKIVLMSGAMNGVFDTIERNITFDDDAASQIPQNSRPAGVDHTFKPAAYEVASFPAPAPSNSSEPFYDGAAPYYASGLAAFNGENPNGAWSLWIYDDLSLNTGYCLHGWDLTITTSP